MRRLYIRVLANDSRGTGNVALDLAVSGKLVVDNQAQLYLISDFEDHDLSHLTILAQAERAFDSEQTGTHYFHSNQTEHFIRFIEVSFDDVRKVRFSCKASNFEPNTEGLNLVPPSVICLTVTCRAFAFNFDPRFMKHYSGTNIFHIQGNPGNSFELNAEHDIMIRDYTSSVSIQVRAVTQLHNYIHQVAVGNEVELAIPPAA